MKHIDFLRFFAEKGITRTYVLPSWILVLLLFGSGNVIFIVPDHIILSVFAGRHSYIFRELLVEIALGVVSDPGSHL